MLAKIAARTASVIVDVDEIPAETATEHVVQNILDGVPNSPLAGRAAPTNASKAVAGE
jgi:hypothetical protein